MLAVRLKNEAPNVAQRVLRGATKDAARDTMDGISTDNIEEDSKDTAEDAPGTAEKPLDEEISDEESLWHYEEDDDSEKEDGVKEPVYYNKVHKTYEP